MRVSYAFVAEFAGVATRVRTLAYYGKGKLRPNEEYDLDGTPCEDVVRGGLCHHPRGVQEKFPRDQGLIDLGIESFLGVPLLDGHGEHPRASGRVRRADHAAGAASTLHLPDLRHPCGRRARAPAGRAETLGERAALPGPLR